MEHAKVWALECSFISLRSMSMDDVIYHQPLSCFRYLLHRRVLGDSHVAPAAVQTKSLPLTPSPPNQPQQSVSHVKS
eukprot:5178481-Amphidinium_carterae.1